VQHSPGLEPQRLVSVTQYRAGALGPPLAVGRTALAGDALGAENVKGKAVHVLHTWKDKLWELGKGREADVPEPEPMTASQPDAQSEGTEDTEAAQLAAPAAVEKQASEGDAASSLQPDPADEVDESSKALSPGG
jgi:translation initiation factor 2D